jgi:hypothetical protein
MCLKSEFPLKTVIVSIVIFSWIYPSSVHCQTAFENELLKKIDSLSISLEELELYPNDAPQGIMIPSGWGGYGTYVFGSVGVSYPEVYHSSKADLIASGGFCIGNPEKFVNFAAGLNVTDVSEINNYSANFSISRKIFKGSSISVGGLQLFANPETSDASWPTFYIAFSHSIQTMPSKTPGGSKLTYTIGVGNGRFIKKSPKDIEAGRGKYGTAVFGGISYELLRRLNINAEWTGMNLGLSLGVRPFKNLFLSFGAGITDLTRYSSDKPSGVFFVGYPLSLKRKT